MISSLSHRVRETVWRRQGIGGWLGWLALQPAAGLFAAGVAARNLAYRVGILRSQRSRVPIISVGNLSVGGTGKTPMTLWLAQALQARGWECAIVLRGYSGSDREVTVVSRGHGPEVDVVRVGDEAVMLAKSFAGVVITARRRADGARVAAELGCNVVLLDDGFQHRALARDFDLVLLGRNHGTVLPAGPMRESWGALERADAVALVRKGELDAFPHDRIPTTIPRFAARLLPHSLVETDGGRWTELPLTRLSGTRVALVSGIADPEPFYAAIREWDPQVVEIFEFPDHYLYTTEDWQRINRTRDAELVVTTEKDLVKLERFPFARGKLVALRLQAEIEQPGDLLRMIEDKIKGEGSDSNLEG